MEEENKTQITEKVMDKLEVAAQDMIEKAKNSENPWYTKVALYVAAVILSGCAFLLGSFSESIAQFIDGLLNSL